MTGSYNGKMSSLFSECARDFKIAHVNAENIFVHWDEFSILFNDETLDVIAISETFLKPWIHSAAVNLNKYILFRNDRLGKEGGGVGVYVHSRHVAKVVHMSQSQYDRKPEFICVEVDTGFRKILVCTVYRPPKIGHIDTVFDCMGGVALNYRHVILIGDFNTNMVQCCTSPMKNELARHIEQLNFAVVPLKPTHHTQSSATWIDLIITNNLEDVSCYGQIEAPGLSKHDLIYCAVKLSQKSKVCNVIQIRDFKNFNYDLLMQDAYSIRWEDVYRNQNITEKVNTFTNHITQLINRHIPIKKIRVTRRAAPWITNDIKQGMNARDAAYRRFKTSKDQEHWEIYRQLRNQCKQLMRNSKSRFLSNAFHNGSSKKFWKIIKDMGVGKSKQSDREPVVNLDMLNTFFIGHCDHNGVEDLSRYQSTIPDNIVFKLNFFNEIDICSAIDNMSSNAVGSDGISIWMIKLLKPVIISALLNIFNTSIERSEYPSPWKSALVIPINKKPTPEVYKDYRAINLLCVVGKIFDKLIFKQMNNYVSSNNLLTNFQSGYRKFFNTQTALIKVTDDIRSAMDRRELTVLVLIDFKRAFDSVFHDVLLKVLSGCNFSEETCKWLKSFLYDRRQCVKTFSGNTSSWANVVKGVPQGSTLSALLFSLFINSIGNVITKAKYMLFADDLQIYFSCPVDQINRGIETLNEELGQIFKWCSDHCLDLNIEKCKYMILGYSKLLHKINYETVDHILIDNTPLVRVNCMRNLGLNMDESLTWETQAVYVSNKIYQGLYQLRRLSCSLDVQFKKKMVNALLFPLIDYSIAAYTDIGSGHGLTLQRAQNACVRFIYNLPIDCHVTPFYKHMKWLKVNERRDYFVATLAFSVLINGEPKYLAERYRKIRDLHDRWTRAPAYLLQIPRHRTGIYNKSFHVHSIRLINAVAKEIDDFHIGKVEKFKLFYKALLLKRYDS